MIALGLSMNCDLVRVGFEDGLYLPDGSVARDNTEMVEAAVTMGRFFGMEPASVDEARERFGIGGPAIA
jgi:3-keto-5-aminohexanoate cleavage enzyme